MVSPNKLIAGLFSLYIGPYTVSTAVVGKPVANLFQLLKHSHFQLFIRTSSLNRSELDAGVQEQFDQLLYITALFNCSFSIFTAQTNSSKVITFPFKLALNFKIPKFGKYILHTYVAGTDLLDMFPNINFFKAESKWSSPAFVLVLKNEHPNYPNLLEKVHSSFYTGFVMVVSNFQSVYQTCNLCGQSKLIHRTLNFKSISKEKSNYFGKINLNRKVLDTDLEPYEKIAVVRSCDQLLEYGPSNGAPTVELCILYTLQTKLNFSLCKREWWGCRISTQTNVASVKRRTRMSMDYLNNDVKPDDRVVVELGLVFDEWGYLIIKDRLNNTNNVTENAAIINPFDAPTYCCLVFSFLAFWIIVVMCESQTLSLAHHDAFLIATNLWGSLLEQSGCGPLFKNRGIIRNNWLIWYFGMLVLSQSYKGTMFSYLTITKEQDYPKTLEQLANKDWDILTFIGKWHKGDLKSVLKANMEEAIDTKTYPAYYKRILNKTKYINDRLRGMRKLTADLYMNQRNNKSSLGIGVPFAEFDLLKHVQMQKQMLEVYLPEKWTSPSVPVKNFMTCMPWTVTRNAFYPVFKWYLGKIFESGLYTRWDSFHDETNGLINLYEIKRQLYSNGMIAHNLSQSVPEGSWRSYLLCLKSSPNCEQAQQNPHSVSVHVFRTIWIATGLGFITAAVMLFLENVLMHLSSNF